MLCALILSIIDGYYSLSSDIWWELDAGEIYLRISFCMRCLSQWGETCPHVYKVNALTTRQMVLILLWFVTSNSL